MFLLGKAPATISPMPGSTGRGRSLTQPPLPWPLFCLSASLLLSPSSADRKQKTVGHGRDHHMSLLVCSFHSFCPFEKGGIQNRIHPPVHVPCHGTRQPAQEAPDHPCSSIMAMHLGEPKKHLYSRMYMPMWVSLHTQVGIFPSTPQLYPTVRNGIFTLRSKLQVQTAVVTPPYAISPGVPSVLQLAVPQER